MARCTDIKLISFGLIIRWRQIGCASLRAAAATCGQQYYSKGGAKRFSGHHQHHHQETLGTEIARTTQLFMSGEHAETFQKHCSSQQRAIQTLARTRRAI